MQSLYHFTHIFNVPLIAKHGLLSKKLLRQNGLWEEIIPGGNEISQNEDAKRGNDQYVSLAYTPYFPMVYRRKREHHICFLEIDLSLVDKAGVLFTRGNATWSKHNRAGNPSAVLQPSDIRIILAGRPDPPQDPQEWHIVSQSEVLVPDRVDSSAIKRCFVLTKDALEICSINDSSFPIEVDPKPFYDKPDDGKVSFSYAYDLRIYDTVAAFRIYSDGPTSKLGLELLLFDGPRLKNFDLIKKIIKDPKKYKDAKYSAKLFGSSASVQFGRLLPGKYTAFLYSYSGNNIIPWSIKDFWP